MRELRPVKLFKLDSDVDFPLSYNRFSILQGSDVPFCYGFYHFTHSDSTVVGVVLEDLTDISCNLINEAKHAKTLYPTIQTYQEYFESTVGFFDISMCL